MAYLARNKVMHDNGLGLEIRREFPFFKKAKGQQCFLDSAASSQKPRVVIDRVTQYLSFEHANIHRGAYQLSAHATNLYEGVKEKVASFLGATDPNTIVFTKNATEAINLVAHSFGELLSEGDTIVLTELEHHSNIVPWQLLGRRRKVNIVFCRLNPDATINLEDLTEKIKRHNPKLLAITGQSNAFGSLTPLDKVLELARRNGAKILLDASQLVVHQKVDVSKIDPDFLVFTGHKLYAPTGVGVLYGRKELLETMPPFLGGGDMIERVTVDGSSWAEVPRRFEAGTPPIAEVIGLGAAIDFVTSIGIDNIKAHEVSLFKSALELLTNTRDVEVYGPKNPDLAASILSFNLKGVHSHDIATVCDSFNVQIRSGHHCAMPAMKALGIQGTARASIAMYSDISDFEVLVQAIERAKQLFRR